MKMLPNKPYNMPMPQSQVSSGTELDEGCELTTAEAGKGLDSAVKKIEKGGKK